MESTRAPALSPPTEMSGPVVVKVFGGRTCLWHSVPNQAADGQASDDKHSFVCVSDAMGAARETYRDDTRRRRRV